MTESDAFLAAIIADPDSDVPRLVFADWLEENGQPERAEFIRLQCSLVRDALTPAERARTETRVNELLGEYKQAWRIPNIPGSQTFHRGFVEYLHTSATDFLQYHERIANAAPVTAIRLSATEQYTNQLAEVPMMRQLRSLEIRNDNIGSRFRELFRPNLFPELRTLILRNNRLWSEYITTLTQLTSSFPKLERLDLSGNPVGDEGIQIIASAESLAGLRELIIRSDDVDYDYTILDTGGLAIAKSRTLTRLRVLNLTGQNMSHAGFVAMIQSPNLREMELLDLSRNNIVGHEWASMLRGSPYLSNLRELNLSRNFIDGQSALDLIHWPQLAKGCTVDLRGCQLNAAGWNVLKESSFASQFLLDSEPWE